MYILAYNSSIDEVLSNSLWDNTAFNTFHKYLYRELFPFIANSIWMQWFEQIWI